jgi:hypothetical protein
MNTDIERYTDAALAIEILMKGAWETILWGGALGIAVWLSFRAIYLILDIAVPRDR